MTEGVYGMRKTNYLSLCVYGIITVLLTLFAPNVLEASASVQRNEETNYKVILEDDADLLTPEEELILSAKMYEITTYGGAAFKTINQNDNSTAAKYAQSYYMECFGTNSGTVFLIDMDNRRIEIYSNGRIYQTITKDYANIITDNIYTYASDGDYYLCAYRAFDQIITLLEGQKIAQPMKHISNALLALIIAMIINFLIARKVSRPKKPTQSEQLGAMRTEYRVTNENDKVIFQTKEYSPRSSGDGGGSGGFGGGGGGGGGFGGGGGGGGGGGHSF